jgi:hypothetical protein
VVVRAHPDRRRNGTRLEWVDDGSELLRPATVARHGENSTLGIRRTIHLDRFRSGSGAIPELGKPPIGVYQENPADADNNPEECPNAGCRAPAARS